MLYKINALPDNIRSTIGRFGKTSLGRTSI